MRALAVVLLTLAALPLMAARGTASEIVGALSQNRVSLTANFSGSEILIFGAIRRTAEELAAEENAEASGGEDYDVIIVIEGPRQRVDIWRMDRVAGIWMNVESQSMASVPSFYAIATTAPLADILSLEADGQYHISPREAIRAEQVGDGSPQALLFSEALLRIREDAAQYLSLERFVHVDRGVLFRTNVRLPANLTEGAYTTRMYLVQGGEVVSQYRTAIFVRKDGLERWLHELAYDQPFLYGLLALAIAVLAGWGASALFRLIRNS
ncbi:TIGR02186 family protein [Cereibacter sphaeroides]|nr:TIGR02186 family protein [Cereibacter sphaeroides]